MTRPRYRLLMQLRPHCAREPEPEGARYGRSAEVAYRVSGPDLDGVAVCDPREAERL